jgi:hypothetical protein
MHTLIWWAICVWADILAWPSPVFMVIGILQFASLRRLTLWWSSVLYMRGGLLVEKENVFHGWKCNITSRVSSCLMSLHYCTKGIYWVCAQVIYYSIHLFWHVIQKRGHALIGQFCVGRSSRRLRPLLRHRAREKREKSSIGGGGA